MYPVNACGGAGLGSDSSPIHRSLLRWLGYGILWEALEFPQGRRRN
jgi:hypothetical protein